MLVIYDRDPIEPPNNAERKRSSMITEIILPERKRDFAYHKIKTYLKSVKNIIMNKNCRYLIISQRKNSKIVLTPTNEGFSNFISLFTGTFYAIVTIMPIILSDTHSLGSLDNGSQTNRSWGIVQAGYS